MFKERYWSSREGLRLFYRDYAGPAERPPILCLHGLTRNSRDFARFADRYAGDWRVIAPDFRGRGRSEWDPAPERYAPPAYADDVIALLAELCISRAVFIGTSLGGLVAMAVAASTPALVAGTVLNDVGPELERAALERISSYVGKSVLFASWDEAAEALEFANAAIHPDYSRADWQHFAWRICREVEGGVSFDYDMAIARNFRLAQKAPAADGWPYFRALCHRPLLVVRAAMSDLLSHRVAMAMVEAHPDAELVEVPSCGHAPDLVEPEATAGIDRLLARVQSRR